MRSSLICSVLAALIACGSFVTDPGSNLTGLPDGLAIDFVVDPGKVRQGESFDATLHARNTTGDTLRVTTSNGCLVTLSVIRDGHRVPFSGTSYGCTAALTTHVFAPGEVRTRQWDMRAELYAENPGDVEGRPAPTGWYVVRAEFPRLAPDGQNPFTERALKVK